MSHATFRRKDGWQEHLHSVAVPIRKGAPWIPKKQAEVIDLALIDRPESYFQAAQLTGALDGALR